MTTGQIIACAVAWTAAIVAAWALASLRGTAREIRAERRTFPWHGGEATITAPMSNADYEALKEKWEREHGNSRTAHHVEELRPVACSALTQQDIDERIAVTDAICDAIDRLKEEEQQ